MEGLIIAVFVVPGFLFLGQLIGSAPRKKGPTTPPPVDDTVPRIIKSTLTPSAFDASSATPLPESRCLIGPAWVTDGDTIRICNTQIRLFGIDAPELNHPYGKAAKWALHRLCKGQTIRAEITEEDTFGRTVARCYLPDGRDLSAEMVKQGLAIDWPKFSGGVYRRLETSEARRKLFLADARQKGRMDVWEKFEGQQSG